MNLKRFNQMAGREQVEWATMWYDEASTVQDGKILMIGESAARQIRSNLSGTLGKPVDLFGSSSALRDVLFWRQLDCFLQDSIYSYDNAVIWMGHHARVDMTGKAPLSAQDYEDFRADFGVLLDRVKEVCPRILVLSNFDIVVPPTKKDKRIRKWRKLLHLPLPQPARNEAESVIIERKNDIIREVTEAKGMKFLDINAIMKESGYARIDHVHYEHKSNQFQTDLVIHNL